MDNLLVSNSAKYSYFILPFKIICTKKTKKEEFKQYDEMEMKNPLKE